MNKVYLWREFWRLCEIVVGPGNVANEKTSLRRKFQSLMNKQMMTVYFSSHNKTLFLIRPFFLNLTCMDSWHYLALHGSISYQWLTLHGSISMAFQNPCIWRNANFIISFQVKILPCKDPNQYLPNMEPYQINGLLI